MVVATRYNLPRMGTSRYALRPRSVMKRGPPTPPSTPSKRIRLADIAGGAARIGASMLPYGNQMLAAYDLARSVTSRRSSRSATTEGSAPPSSSAGGGRAFGRAGGTYKGRVRPKRKVRPGFKGKAQAKGFSLHMERGGTVNDPYCAYIGHGSCPQVVMRRVMLGCLLKIILRRMGLSFSNVVHPLTFLTIGDKFDLLIKLNQETGFITTISYTLTVNQPSFQSVLDGLVNAWVVAVQAQVFTSSVDWKLVEFRFDPAGAGDLTAVRVPLENARITFECESNLKVQNRSVPSAEDDADDEVDRIPVSGRIYRFNGMGSNFKRTAIQAIGEVNFEPVGEKQDGLYTYSAGVAGGADVLKEPPNPYNFVRCYGHGKVYLDPGVIKNSFIKYKRTMYLSTLLRYVVGTNEAAANSTIAVQQNIGKFNLIAVEKLIETSNTTPTQLISLAYECDLKVFGYIQTKLLDNTIGEEYLGTTPA